MKEIIQLILSLPALIKAFKSVISFFESHFGPDWVAKLNELGDANKRLETATTNEEKDAALKAIARAFYRKP